MHRRERAFNQAADFLPAQDKRQLIGPLGIGRLFHAPVALQRFVKKEAQSGHPLIDRVGGEMPLPKQIPLILANVLGLKFFNRPVEVTAQIRNHAQVGARGTLRVISTLEFLEHQRL